MSVLYRLMLAAVVLLLVAGARSDGADDRPARRLTIRPAPTEEWKAGARDVEKILTSAASELWVHFPERELPPIVVEPRGGPIMLYQRGAGGEYRVRLNTGGLYWSQYAFQFAHEFCHILCNGRAGDSANKWFEESICEVASLYSLRAMARTWRTAPPYPNWRDYASKLEQYAQDRMDNAKLPQGVTLAGWVKENLPLLRKDAVMREKNLVVATALLPMFEKSPEHWEAVGYMNTADNGTPRSFELFLADWHAQSPRRHKAFIRDLAAALGVDSIPE